MGGKQKERQDEDPRRQIDKQIHTHRQVIDLALGHQQQQHILVDVVVERPQTLSGEIG